MFCVNSNGTHTWAAAHLIFHIILVLVFRWWWLVLCASNTHAHTRIHTYTQAQEIVHETNDDGNWRMGSVRAWNGNERKNTKITFIYFCHKSFIKSDKLICCTFNKWIGRPVWIFWPIFSSHIARQQRGTTTWAIDQEKRRSHWCVLRRVAWSAKEKKKKRFLVSPFGVEK